MTEIEKKALALVNEFSDYEVPDLDEAQYSTTIQALCRAIEQHEAFRQEVSEAVEKYLGHQSPWPDTSLRRFIIAKPDPLVEAMNESLDRLGAFDAEEANNLRAALAKRGLQVTEIER